MLLLNKSRVLCYSEIEDRGHCLPFSICYDIIVFQFVLANVILRSCFHFSVLTMVISKRELL